MHLQLTRLTSTNSESFDPECLNIIRSYLPELSQKVEAFAQDVPPLKTMQADLALSYSVLAMQRVSRGAIIPLPCSTHAVHSRLT